MNAFLKWALALLAALLAGQAGAQVTFYEHQNFEGRSFTALQPLDDFNRAGFNDRASSVVVTGNPWEVCEDVRFGGQCMILRPGSYRSLRDMRMNNRLSSARPIGRHGHHHDDRYAPQPLPGQIAFFEHEGFQGRAFNTENDVVNFQRFGFNDRASSAVVLGERWEACEHVGFAGRCVILRPGRYPDLNAMGLGNRISSVRVVHPEANFDDDRYAPPPAPVYDWRRRPREQVYHVNVASGACRVCRPAAALLDRARTGDAAAARRAQPGRRRGGRHRGRHPRPPGRRPRPRRRHRGGRSRRRGDRLPGGPRQQPGHHGAGRAALPDRAHAGPA